MEWRSPKDYPKSGETIKVLMPDDSVHIGHFIKDANLYVRNVNRYRLHDIGSKKTFKPSDIKGWSY